MFSHCWGGKEDEEKKISTEIKVVSGDVQALSFNFYGVTFGGVYDP